MDWFIVGGIILAVLILGSLAAVAWWNLAARAAPYRDELERQQAAGAKSQEESVVVIRSDDAPRP